MKKYHHLSLKQRYQIEALLGARKSQTFIAARLGCNKSTISNELRRNTRSTGPGAKVYDAEFAHRQANRRRAEYYPHRRFTLQMKDWIAHLLVEEKLSPELITQRGRKEFGYFVSHETIYTWIWEMKKSTRQVDAPYKYLYNELKHGRRRRKRGNYQQNRGCIPNRVSIEQRPSRVDKRTRVGDVEVDLIMGKNNRPGLLIVTDRASLKTRLTKINSKNSAQIAQAIIQLLKPWKGIVKTLTYDNDLAFAMHEKVNKALNTSSYFTHPYSSQEKGTVENRIGILRRFFPKKTDFDQITTKQIKRVEKLLNKRPVRKFDYNTPNAVFLKKINVALFS